MPGIYVPPQVQPPAHVQYVQTEARARDYSRPCPPATQGTTAAPGIVKDAGRGQSLRLTSVSNVVPHFHAVPLSTLWTLKAGETVSRGLEAWGQKAHWTIVWQLPRDWAVPATTVFSGTFEQAAQQVLHVLSREGVLLRGEIYEGNRTLVVKPTGEQ